MKKKNITGVSIFKKAVLFTILLAAGSNAKSQTMADTIRNELIAINNVFDSAFYLTFDVDISYSSDTLYAGTDSADHSYHEMKGTYTFHGKKALYRLGSIEYMQNDSFTIGVYHDNKLILVGKTGGMLQGPGSFVPTRKLIDSLMVTLEQDYIYSISGSDSTGMVISLSPVDTANLYQKIEMEYDSLTHQLRELRYAFTDVGYVSMQGTTQVTRDAIMIFRFKNYRVQHAGPEVFSETRYLFFDGPDEIKPANVYKNYTIYKNY